MNNEHHHDEHEEGVAYNQDDNGTYNMRRHFPQFSSLLDKHIENDIGRIFNVQCYLTFMGSPPRIQMNSSLISTFFVEVMTIPQASRN